MTIKQSFVVITSIVILVVIGGIVAYHSIRRNAIAETRQADNAALALAKHSVDSLVQITKIPQPERKIIVYYPHKKVNADSIFNAGIIKGVDSLREIFNYAAQSEDTTIQFDSVGTLYHHYDPLSHIGYFDLQLTPISERTITIHDSVFVTQPPLDLSHQITFRTAGCVVVGAGIGAAIGNIPGAAIGGFVGLLGDYIF